MSPLKSFPKRDGGRKTQLLRHSFDKRQRNELQIGLLFGELRRRLLLFLVSISAAAAAG